MYFAILYVMLLYYSFLVYLFLSVIMNVVTRDVDYSLVQRETGFLLNDWETILSHVEGHR